MLDLTQFNDLSQTTKKIENDLIDFITNQDKEVLLKRVNKNDLNIISEQLSSYINIIKEINSNNITKNNKNQKLEITYNWPSEPPTKDEDSNNFLIKSMYIPEIKKKTKKERSFSQKYNKTKDSVIFERIITIGFSILVVGFVMIMLLGLVFMIYINSKKS